MKPYLKYKNSGIDWIGKIPEHWSRNKISRVAFIKGRIGWRGYTVKDLCDENEGVLVIGATHIDSNGNIDLSNPTYLTIKKYEESPEIQLHGDEILMVKVGATVGKIGYFKNEIGKR